MLPLSYFLKMMLCSTAFYSYYLLALRNKRFHQYNRVYLLSSVIASWTIPLLHFRMPLSNQSEKPLAAALLSLSTRSSAFEAEPVMHSIGSFEWTQWLPAAYYFICALFLGSLLFALLRIYGIYRQAPKRKIDRIVLVDTTEPSAPFSFFRLLFWNTAIDAQSEAGKRIYTHELTHIKEKHSLDKLLLQLQLTVAWFHPVSWLMKREMDLIHEFIADNKAVQDADTAAFASMLLTAAYPQKNNRLTHPFFFSPVKRRLQMILREKKERFSYLRRLTALPLLALAVVFFAFKTPATLSGTAQKAKNELILVLDAAHGGDDDGATGAEGSKEKVLTLAICKKLEQLSGEYNIRIRCTRNSDVSKSLAERVQWSNAMQADLFLSVHINQSSAVRDNAYQLGINPKSRDYAKSLLLANAIGSKLQQQKLPVEIVDHSMAYILKSIRHPALLIECGNLDDPENMALLQHPERMELMCRALLSGMVDYQNRSLAK